MKRRSTFALVAALVALMALLVGAGAAPAAAGKTTSPFAGRYHDFGGYGWSPSNGEIQVSGNGRISGKTTFSIYSDYLQTTVRTYRGRVAADGAMQVEVDLTRTLQLGGPFTDTYVDTGVAAMAGTTLVFTGTRVHADGFEEAVTYAWYRH